MRRPHSLLPLQTFDESCCLLEIARLIGLRVSTRSKDLAGTPTSASPRLPHDTTPPRHAPPTPPRPALPRQSGSGTLALPASVVLVAGIAPSDSTHNYCNVMSYSAAAPARTQPGLRH